MDSAQMLRPSACRIGLVIVTFLMGICHENESAAFDKSALLVKIVGELTRPEVDYSEKLNATLRKGATPENNFFTVFFPYIPDEYLDESQGPWVEKFCKELGCPPLQPDRPVFRPLLLSYFPEAQDQAELNTQLTNALHDFWDAEKTPLIARWLEMNEEVLDQILAATARPVGYYPAIVPESEPLVAHHYSDLIYVGQVVNLTAVRVMRSLTTNNLRQARRDLIALHQLAHLIGQRPGSMIQLYVSYAVIEVLQSAQGCYLLHEKLERTMCRSYVRVVSAIPRPPLAVKVLLMGDLLAIQEVVDRMQSWKVQFRLTSSNDKTFSLDAEDLALCLAMNVLLDKQAVAEGVTAYYQGLAKITQQAYSLRRLQELKSFQNLHRCEDAEAMKEDDLSRGLLKFLGLSLLRRDGLNRIARSRAFGSYIARMIASDPRMMDVREIEIETYRAMLPALASMVLEVTSTGVWPISTENLLDPSGQPVAGDPFYGRPFELGMSPIDGLNYCQLSVAEPEVNHEQEPAEPYSVPRRVRIYFTQRIRSD